MLRFRKLCLLLPTAFLLLPASSRAALISTYDLTTLCFLSTDVVEARLTRHHLSGQEEWKDTFTATVLNPLQGKLKAGDRVSGLDLTSYDPAQTGRRCLLFLTPNTLASPSPARAVPRRVVDMLLIDSHDRVRRYFQWSNPGGLVAEGFRLVPVAPPSSKKITREHGALVYSYQENDGFVEDDSAEPRYRTRAEERLLIASRWAVAKQLQAPPYQVLHH